MTKRKSLHDWIADLSSPKRGVRKRACDRIAEMDGLDELALAEKPLLRLTDDADGELLRSALFALGAVPAPSEATFQLAASIFVDPSRDDQTRQSASDVLARFGTRAIAFYVAALPSWPKGAASAIEWRNVTAPRESPKDASALKRALLPLLYHLESGDPAVVAEAARSIARCGVPLPSAKPKLLEIVRDASGDRRARAWAAEALGATQSPDVLEDLFALAAASTPDDAGGWEPSVGRASAEAIASFRPDGWPWLKRLLRSDNPSAVRVALRVLPSVPHKNPEVAAILGEMAASQDESVAIAAVATIAGYYSPLRAGSRPSSVDPLASVEAMFRRPNLAARATATAALGNPRPWSAEQSKRADTLLIEALDDPHAAIRAIAAHNLWSRGPYAAPALDALMRRLEKEERPQAGGTNGRECLWVDAFSPRLSSADLQGELEKKIAKTGPEGRLVVREVRENIVAAIGGIGPPAAKRALPLLRRLLADPDEDPALLPALRRAIASLEPMAPDSSQRTLALLKSRKREEALEGLGLVARGTALTPEVVRALRSHLRSGQMDRKLEALVAAERLGELLAELVEDVAPTLASRHDYERTHALRAIHAMGAAAAERVAGQLVAMLDEDAGLARFDLAEWPAELGPTFAAEAPKRFWARLRDARSDPLARALAAVGLARLGDRSGEVEEALRTVADAPNHAAPQSKAWLELEMAKSVAAKVVAAF